MIYEVIKKKAAKKGISVAEVARRAGIDPTLPGKWRTVSPSVINAQKVAQVLDCTVDDLLREDTADPV